MIKSQKGQATVELALSLSILILLVFGIIDFGRIFHAYLTLENAGREAGRIASLGAEDTDIVNTAKQAAPSLIKDKIIVKPSPTKEKRISGSYVTINLSYPVSLSIPFLKGVLPDPLILQSKTVMRVE